jgi:hypothetical protein
MFKNRVFIDGEALFCAKKKALRLQKQHFVSACMVFRALMFVTG